MFEYKTDLRRKFQSYYINYLQKQNSNIFSLCTQILSAFQFTYLAKYCEIKQSSPKFSALFMSGNC